MSRLETDTSLVRRALGGDRKAFESLVDLHLRPAFGIAYALTGSAHDSEDIVQDAFLRAYRNLPALKRGNFGPWLGGIVRHVAADQRRLSERRERADKQLQAHFKESVETAPDGGTVEREEEDLFVRRELGALPEELRLPLVLYYFEGESTDRVAERLGLRPATARKRLQLARDRLRTQLLAKFEDGMARVSPRAALKRSILAAIGGLPFLPGGETGAASFPLQARLLSYFSAGGGIVGANKLAAFLLAAALFLAGGLIIADPLGWRRSGRDVTASHRGNLPGRVTKVEPPKVASPATAASESPIADVLDGQAPLFGVVMGAGGEPAVGVVVTAYRLGPDEGAEVAWREDPPQVSSGLKGSFRFEEIEDGPWGLVAVDPRGGHGVVPRILVPASGPVVIQLESGDTREGRVVDMEDQPIAGVDISISSLTAQRLPRFPMEALKLTADEEGKFLLPGLPPGSYQIGAKHAALWPAEATVDVPSEEPIEIRLKPAGCIEARVYLRDRSHALRNEIVWALNCTPNGRSGSGVKTGSEGELTLSPLNPGEHNLVFQHEGFQPVAMHADLTLAHPLRDVEIIFMEGITVKGVIRNKSDELLPGATLYWKRPGACGAEAIECKSDKAGRYSVSGLLAGRWSVMMRGFTDQDRRTMKAQLTEDVTQEIDVVMDVPGPIRILVTDMDGTPLEGVWVNGGINTPQLSGDLEYEKTDALGWLTITVAAAQGTLHLKAGSDGLGWAMTQVDLSQLTGPITLRLEPIGRISGNVIDAGGNHIRGAVVTFTSGNYVGTARTNSTGEFTVALPARKYVVEAMGGARGVGRIDEVVILPGKESVVAIPLDTSSTIRGRLIDADGKPVGNPYLSVNSMAPCVFLFIEGTKKRDRIEAGVDLEGWFAAIVPPGSYEVKVVVPGLQQSQTISGVRPGDPPVEVQLERPPPRVRRVTGKVLDGGQAVEGVSLRYYRLPDLRSTDTRAVSGLGGAFELADVDGDRIVVVGNCPRFAFARSAEVAVPEEGTLEGILVTVVEGADMEIHVKDAEGKLVADAIVEISNEHAIAASVYGASDLEGVCRLRRVPQGEYDLRVRSAAWTKSKHQKVKWEADGAPVNVVLGSK